MASDVVSTPPQLSSSAMVAVIFRCSMATAAGSPVTKNVKLSGPSDAVSLVMEVATAAFVWPGSNTTTP